MLAAQRPEFAVTAGDNSYLVAAEPLLDRNIFRPLGDLIGQHAAVRLPRRPRQLLAGPRRDQQRVRHPAGRPLRARATGRSRSSSSATSRTSRRRSRFARAVRCASPDRRCASSPATGRCNPGDALLPVVREGGAAAVFSGHLHRYERRTVDGVQTFTVGTGGQGPGSLDSHEDDARRRPSACSTSARSCSRCEPGGAIGYTYLDKHGSVLDHGGI